MRHFFGKGEVFAWVPAGHTVGAVCAVVVESQTHTTDSSAFNRRCLAMNKNWKSP